MEDRMAKKKLKIEVQLKEDSYHTPKGKNEYIQGKDKGAVKKEEVKNPGVLISRLSHPVTISYNGEGMLIPARGRSKVADTNKIGALPKGIFLKKL